MVMQGLLHCERSEAISLIGNGFATFKMTKNKNPSHLCEGFFVSCIWKDFILSQSYFLRFISVYFPFPCFSAHPLSGHTVFAKQSCSNGHLV